MELMKKTAAELSEMLTKKEVSAVELTQAALARTAETDEKVGAYITVAGQQAIEAAKTIDNKRAAGEALSPLAGIPVAIKDNICTEGLLTTCASTIFPSVTS